MTETLLFKELPNGMTILGQPMDTVGSAALSLLTTAGSSHDEAPYAGSAAVAAEWLLRGAGDRDTRALHDALDGLGCQHSENVQCEHIQFTAAQLGRNLADVLRIYADILRRPRLEDKTFEPCRALTVQDLQSLEDEPAQKANLILRERFYPYPLGRGPYGTEQTLAALTPQAVRRQVQRHFVPKGSMLSVAGKFDWNAVCGLIEELFGDWNAPEDEPVATTPPPGGVTHVHKDSAQVHITLGHKTVPAGHRDYYSARMAETLLSGGMSGRLFTEVREKRGLVYHVSTRYHSLKTHAGMFTYAGTSPEKAQQTLEVTIGELRRLVEGIGEDEMARARIQLKSALVMQGESTSARANALASDWYHLRRLRSLEEISCQIDDMNIDRIREHLRAFPAKHLAVLTIGPEPLKTEGICD